MKGLSTQRQGQLGVNVVERVTLEMKWRWQQLDAVNDDGVDGLIFVEDKGVPTGQILYVQVKCHGSSRIDQSGRLCIAFKRESLSHNYERWRRVVGAAILVHVEPTSPYQARWVNLLQPGAVKGTQVNVDQNSIFDASSALPLKRLCGTIHRDLLKPRIDTEAEDYEYIKKNSTEFQNGAHIFYKSLEKNRPRLADGGAEVAFTNDGWRHITRQNRSRLLQLQSMQLLGCIPKVLLAYRESDLEIGDSFPDGSRQVYARTAVTFPFRQTSMVKLILRRRREGSSFRYSFYSIYETRRGRDVLGRR